MRQIPLGNVTAVTNKRAIIMLQMFNHGHNTWTDLYKRRKGGDKKGEEEDE